MKASQLYPTIIVAGLVTQFSADAQGAKTFQRYYDRFSRSFISSDWGTVTGLIAKDFHAKGPDGRMMTWPAIVGEFKRERSSLRSPRWARTVKSVTLQRGVAIVVVEGHLGGITSDPNAKPHILSFDATSKDIWVKNSIGWQIESSEVIRSSGSVDGKPLKIR